MEGMACDTKLKSHHYHLRVISSGLTPRESKNFTTTQIDACDILFKLVLMGNYRQISRPSKGHTDQAEELGEAYRQNNYYLPADYTVTTRAELFDELNVPTVPQWAMFEATGSLKHDRDFCLLYSPEIPVFCSGLGDEYPVEGQPECPQNKAKARFRSAPRQKPRTDDAPPPAEGAAGAGDPSVPGESVSLPADLPSEVDF